MPDHTHYCYISKDRSYQTRWRKIPAEGIDPPSKPSEARLGPAYSLLLKKKARARKRR